MAGISGWPQPCNTLELVSWLQRSHAFTTVPDNLKITFYILGINFRISVSACFTFIYMYIWIYKKYIHMSTYEYMTKIMLNGMYALLFIIYIIFHDILLNTMMWDTNNILNFLLPMVGHQEETKIPCQKTRRENCHIVMFPFLTSFNRMR